MVMRLYCKVLPICQSMLILARRLISRDYGFWYSSSTPDDIAVLYSPRPYSIRVERSPIRRFS